MSSVPLPQLPSLSSTPPGPGSGAVENPQDTETNTKFSTVLEGEQAALDNQDRHPSPVSDASDEGQILPEAPAVAEPVAGDGKPLPDLHGELAGLMIADTPGESGAAVAQDAGVLQAQAVLAPVTGVAVTASRVVTPSGTGAQERSGVSLDYLVKRIETVTVPGDRISRIAAEPLNTVSAAVQQGIQTDVLPVQSAPSAAVAADLKAIPVPVSQFNIVQALIDDPSGSGTSAHSPVSSVAATTGPGTITGSVSLPSTTLEVPFRQAGWDAALGERVVWMVNQKLQAAEIKLNPPQLGPMEVRINMQNDQAQVTFTAHHAHVRDALEAAIPRLREMFSNSGLDLVDVGVSQQSFSQRDQAGSRSEPSSAGLAADNGSRPGDESSTVTAVSNLSASAIDLFA